MLRSKSAPRIDESARESGFVDLGAKEDGWPLGRTVLVVWLLSLLAVVAVGVLHVLIMRAELRNHEIQRAVADVEDRVDLVIEHAINDGVVNGDPAALEEYDRLMHEHIVRPATAGLALWSPEGKILYALDHSFTGKELPLPQGAQLAFDTMEVQAGILDDSNPATDQTPGWTPDTAIEVYAPVVSAQGERYVWEVALRRERVAREASQLVLVMAILLAAGAGLLLTAQGILGRKLVQRHDRERAYRRWLTQRVAEVGSVERRQIAADLHDGVVQDLTGVVLDLESPVDGVKRSPEERRDRRQLSARIRNVVATLRGQTAELYPVASSRLDVPEGLQTIIDRQRTEMDVTLDIDPSATVAPSYRWLVFRVTQEAMRNANQHSGGDRIDVRLVGHGPTTVLTVDDDGEGFAPETDAVEPGHMGLTLMSDMATAAGASLSIRSAPGKGTTIRLEVPS